MDEARLGSIVVVEACAELIVVVASCAGATVVVVVHNQFTLGTVEIRPAPLD